jgi:hypothetical protein
MDVIAERHATEHLAYKPVLTPATCTDCGSRSGPEGAKDWTCDECMKADATYRAARALKVEAALALNLGPPTHVDLLRWRAGLTVGDELAIRCTFFEVERGWLPQECLDQWPLPPREMRIHPPGITGPHSASSRP